MLREDNTTHSYGDTSTSNCLRQLSTLENFFHFFCAKKFQKELKPNDPMDLCQITRMPTFLFYRSTVVAVYVAVRQNGIDDRTLQDDLIIDE